MTEIYDRRANQIAPRPAATAIVSRGRALCPEWQNYRRRTGPTRPDLRAFERHDDAENALQYFRAAHLDRPEHSIFFVGYADPESPAGVLRSSPPNELVSLDEDEPAQPLRCQLEQFQFSAHASRESILDYIKKVAPKKLVLVHGDVPAIEWMRASAARRRCRENRDHRAAARSGDRVVARA